MKGERDSVFTKDLSQYSVKEEIFIRIFIRSFSAGEEVKMGKREEYLPLNDLKWRYLFIFVRSQHYSFMVDKCNSQSNMAAKSE